MSIGNRPVNIYQIFEEENQSLTTPRLMPVVFGLLRQKERQVYVGPYDGNSATYMLPNNSLKPGAVIEESSIKVYLDSKIKGKIELDPSHYYYNSSGLTIKDNAEIDFEVLSTTSSSGRIFKQGNDVFLEDKNANFVAANIFGDPNEALGNKGDLVTVLGLFAESYRVLSVFSKTLIQISPLVPNSANNALVDSKLANAFTARPDRIYEGLNYSIDRNVIVGSSSNSLLISTLVYMSFDAIRNDKNGELQVIENDAELLDLAPFSPDNEVGYALSILRRKASRKIGYVSLPDKTYASFLAALEMVEGREAYFLIPLTQDKRVCDAFSAHVEDMSQPERRKERRTYINQPIPDIVTKLSDKNAAMSISLGVYIITDPTAEFILNGVTPGDIITLTNVSGDGQNISGDYTISNVLSQESVQLFEEVPNRIFVGGDGFVQNNGNRFYTQINVSTALDGDELLIENGDFAGVYTIQNTAPNEIETEVIGGTTYYSVPLSGVASGFFEANNNLSWLIVRGAAAIPQVNGVEYSVRTPNLTNVQKAEYIRDLGLAYGSRRTTLVVPGTFRTTFDVVAEDGTIEQGEGNVPGYFAATEIVGHRFGRGVGRPISGERLQGFSVANNMISFREEELQTMASGGVLVVYQEEITSAPTIYQQLTTDTSSIQRQELSVTESVDQFAKILRENIRPLMGNNNISDQLLNTIRIRTNAIISSAKSNEGLNGAIVGKGTELLSLERSTSCADTIVCEIDIDPLIPFNKFVARLYI